PSMALVCAAQRNYSAAEVVDQQLERMVKTAFGANHPDFAVALNKLGFVYWKQGKYSEAEGLYKRALAIRHANHRDVAWTLNDLALVYRAQGKYAEAEGLFKRALSIREKALGANHRDVGQTLHNLALVYADQGKNGKAA